MISGNSRPKAQVRRAAPPPAQPAPMAHPTRRPESPPDPASPAPAANGARLRALAGEMGLELQEEQCSTLLAYGSLLRRWNRVHNLTAIDSDENLLTHHLLDCLAIVRPLEQALERYVAMPPDATIAAGAIGFLDAGSGAGLPGIALAVVHPDWQGHLVDAVQKKCAFLQQAIVELRLRNVTALHARLESCKLEPQTLIVSRAFASLRDMVTITRPLLAPQGLWAAMKGRSPMQEIRDLPPGIEVLDTITLRVPSLDQQRHLVLMRAAGGAPDTGPRRAAPASAHR